MTYIYINTTFYLIFFLGYALTFYLTFYLASILTFCLAFYLAFSLASVRVQACPTASGAGDMLFGGRGGGRRRR